MFLIHFVILFSKPTSWILLFNMHLQEELRVVGFVVEFRCSKMEFTFWSTIELCYCWQTMALKSHVAFPRSGTIFKVMVKVLSIIIKAMGISSLRCFAFHYFHMLQAPWNIFCWNYFGQLGCRCRKKYFLWRVGGTWMWLKKNSSSFWRHKFTQ
jgi:hypothetical protein